MSDILETSPPASESGNIRLLPDDLSPFSLSQVRFSPLLPFQFLRPESQWRSIDLSGIEMAAPKGMVRDPVYGAIELTPLEQSIVNHPAFQRLQDVAQMSSRHTILGSELIHSRYEHSIGALCIADRIATQLGLSQEQRKLVRIGALLHDFGHLPYSHTLEKIVGRAMGFDHNKNLIDRINDTGIGKILADNGVDAGFLVKEIETAKKQPTVIGCTVKLADRFDYVVRDLHYAPVKPEIKERAKDLATTIIGGMGLNGERLTVEHTLMPQVLEFSKLRDLVFTNFALSPATLIFVKRFEEAFRDAFLRDPDLKSAVLSLTDEELLEYLPEDETEMLRGPIEHFERPILGFALSDIKDESLSFFEDGRFVSEVSAKLCRELPVEGFSAIVTPCCASSPIMFFVSGAPGDDKEPTLEILPDVVQRENRFAFVSLTSEHAHREAELAMIILDLVRPHLKDGAEPTPRIVGTIEESVFDSKVIEVKNSLRSQLLFGGIPESMIVNNQPYYFADSTPEAIGSF